MGIGIWQGQQLGDNSFDVGDLLKNISIQAVVLAVSSVRHVTLKRSVYRKSYDSEGNSGKDYGENNEHWRTYEA